MTGPERPTEQPTEQPASCPSCGATVRHDVPWCLQCYASLAAPRLPVSDDRAPDDVAPAGVPRPAGAARPADAAELDRIAERMLAELSTTSTALPSWWSRLPTTPAGKVAWVAGAIAVASVALVLVLAVLGLVL